MQLYVACNAPIWGKTAEVYKDSNIQNVHLGRYMDRRIYGQSSCYDSAGALNFGPYIQRYTSQNKILNTVIG